jgi:hypothetical protein
MGMAETHHGARTVPKRNYHNNESFQVWQVKKGKIICGRYQLNIWLVSRISVSANRAIHGCARIVIGNILFEISLLGPTVMSFSRSA